MTWAWDVSTINPTRWGRVERILWDDPFLPGDPKSKLQKGWVSSLDGDSDNIQILGNTKK